MKKKKQEFKCALGTFNGSQLSLQQTLQPAKYVSNTYKEYQCRLLIYHIAFV